MTLRNSKSWLTVSFSKPVTNRLRARSRSLRKASRSFCFSSRFFIAALGCGLRRVKYRDVERYARAHSGAHGRRLHILALGRSRLSFQHSLNQARGVLDQLVFGEAQLAYR